MTVIKRGNSWQVSVGSGADRFRGTAQSEAEGKLIEAQELLKRQQKALGIIPAEVKPKDSITLGKLFEVAKRGPWRSRGIDSIRNAEHILSHLGASTDVAEIHRETVEELIEELYELGNSGATINRKLSALSVLLSLAEDHRYIERAPKISRQEEGDHRIRYFNNADEQEMLRICDETGMQDLKDFIVFAIDTGFRRSEILGLTLRDCETGTAVLHAGETKSGKGRSVPLTERSREIVLRRNALGYRTLFEDLSDTKLRRRWELLRASVRDPGKHFIVHTLRHTCASRLAISGKSGPFIQTWMGHSSPMVTARYMHFSSSSLQEGLEALDSYRMK